MNALSPIRVNHSWNYPTHGYKWTQDPTPAASGVWESYESSPCEMIHYPRASKIRPDRSILHHSLVSMSSDIKCLQSFSIWVIAVCLPEGESD